MAGTTAALVRAVDPAQLLPPIRESTTTAAVALHTAIYDPGLILLVSPSLRQSKELAPFDRANSLLYVR